MPDKKENKCVTFGDSVISSRSETDTIYFGESRPDYEFWNYDGMGTDWTATSLYADDLINFNSYKENKMPSTNNFWKYNEDKILKQLEEYIASTYNQHYVDDNGGAKQQTLDKIKYNRREGFCAGNVTKYIDRYDTKGTPRADLFKVLHYTILLINHLNLIENK